MEIVCSPQLDRLGDVTQMIGLAFDITDRVEKENELSRVLETREKLFSVIAHDLKGPVSNLIGVSTILSEDLEFMSKDEVSEFIQMIKRSSTSASELLKNLLTWSRNISNRIPFSLQEIVLADELKQVLDFYYEAARLKGIEFELAIKQPNLSIIADLQMVNTIIRNLVANAIKFTSKNGRITIEVFKTSNQTYISIKDSGVGMTADQIDSILKKDGRLQRPGTNKEKGTGLGLIIVQDFLKKHNGQMSIESEVGKGSTFKVHFPNVI